MLVPAGEEESNESHHYNSRQRLEEGSAMIVAHARACLLAWRARSWVLGLLSLALLAVWAAPARAVTFTQQTLPVNGSNGTEDVALDADGDVFVTDYANKRVVELPAGG